MSDLSFYQLKLSRCELRMSKQ